MEMHIPFKVLYINKYPNACTRADSPQNEKKICILLNDI